MSHIRAALFAAALAVCGSQIASAHEFKAGDLEIGHPWSRAVPAGASVASGYFIITNTGKSADRLLSISSDISAKAEVHSMAMKDGVMTMRPVEGGLDIPAGGTVTLKPGANHVMFMDLKQHPRKGDRFKATLTFEKAGPVTVDFVVDGMGAGGAMKMKMDHDHAK